MQSEELSKVYMSMTDSEKNAALDHVLDMDVAPIDMVVAFYWILRPNRAEDLAAKLKARFTCRLEDPASPLKEPRSSEPDPTK